MLLTLVIVFATFALGLLVYAVHSRRQIRELNQRAGERLGEIQTKHDARVGRLQRKYSAQAEQGHLEFIRDLLPALDALGRAMELADDDRPPGALLEGLKMVDRELAAVLTRHDIDRCIPEPGDRFDPAIHEALATIDGDDVEPGQIAECFRAGYVHAGQVLRPAGVAVAARSADDERDGADADQRTASSSEDDDPCDSNGEASSTRL